MVEPLFKLIFASPPKVGDVLALGGSEGKHAAAVRRIREGEAIQFADGSGVRVRALVSSVQQNSLSAKVTEVLVEHAPAVKLTLVQALATLLQMAHHVLGQNDGRVNDDAKVNGA